MATLLKRRTSTARPPRRNLGDLQTNISNRLKKAPSSSGTLAGVTRPSHLAADDAVDSILRDTPLSIDPSSPDFVFDKIRKTKSDVNLIQRNDDPATEIPLTGRAAGGITPAPRAGGEPNEPRDPAAEPRALSGGSASRLPGEDLAGQRARLGIGESVPTGPPATAASRANIQRRSLGREARSISQDALNIAGRAGQDAQRLSTRLQNEAEVSSQEAANVAGIDASLAEERSTGIQTRAAARAGIRPGSGRFAGLQQRTGLQFAAQRVGAQTRARRAADQAQFQNLATAFSASQSLLSQGLSAGIQSLNTAANLATPLPSAGLTPYQSASLGIRQDELASQGAARDEATAARTERDAAAAALTAEREARAARGEERADKSGARSDENLELNRQRAAREGAAVVAKGQKEKADADRKKVALAQSRYDKAIARADKAEGVVSGSKKVRPAEVKKAASLRKEADREEELLGRAEGIPVAFTRASRLISSLDGLEGRDLRKAASDIEPGLTKLFSLGSDLPPHLRGSSIGSVVALLMKANPTMSIVDILQNAIDQNLLTKR